MKRSEMRSRWGEATETVSPANPRKRLLALEALTSRIGCHPIPTAPTMLRIAAAIDLPPSGEGGKQLLRTKACALRACL
jgi:hypothetical protein